MLIDLTYVLKGLNCQSYINQVASHAGKLAPFRLYEQTCNSTSFSL